MKLSARNQLKGVVVEVRKGQTTAHVRVDIGSGVIVTSSWLEGRRSRDCRDQGIGCDDREIGARR